MTDRADLKRLTDAGRQVAVGDRVMDLATAVELVRILDAIDRAVAALEEEQAPPLEPCPSAGQQPPRQRWHLSGWRLSRDDEGATTDD